MCSNHLPYYFVICQNVPSSRCQQTNTLVGTRLYFFGENNLTTFTSIEVWYLDLSSSFNISTPPWHSDVVMSVGYNFGTSCLSPIDNSTVFLIGGRMLWLATSATTDYYSNTSSVYQFNSKTLQWTTPTINTFNSSFTSRNNIHIVIDKNGKIFIFGGTNFISSTDTPNYTFYNDMNALDSTNMTWSTQTQSQSTLTYVGYTATLLQNDLIVYIGGSSGSGTSVRLNDISQNGNIIIYGASTHDSSGDIVYVFSDIAILNTNSWAQPQHQFHLQIIFILDIKNYTWVTAFSIPITTNPVKQIQNNSNSSTD
ncbi:galactose oxidase [Gigaspora margarita]|uniref:Galactose oxidase n=1 Tax=Gigaspora margarita TaxID=4874 RepID=A0A8H4ESY7_GIGMA|nr:galactose oxidase [Gigaspora margarita]